ncbi:MAG: class I SAM-dependent methyltransferase [Pseudomonadota bacterium]
MIASAAKPTGMDLDHRADIDFVLGLRRRWADTLYPALRREYDVATSENSPVTHKEAAPIIHDLPCYRWFAWMERGSQKQLWRAVADAVGDGRIIAEPDQPIGSLELNPGLELPGWYTDWDIHVQPGGVWRADASAEVYELGAKLVMLGENDDYAFHRMFTAAATHDLSDRNVTRLIDLGCGFGKSTWPLKRSFPDAEVIGVDLAATCLRLAHAKAEALDLAIRFHQADATATGLEPDSADLVTATMVLHEMPQQAIRAFFAETARLLKPGGLLRLLEFQLTGEPFRDVAMMEHGARNNEPFMPGMMAADTAAMAEDAGLANARWVAFDERPDGGRLDGLNWPKRPEWHFPWAILEAEKPS